MPDICGQGQEHKLQFCSLVSGSTWVDPNLPCKYQTRVEVDGSDKHTILQLITSVRRFLVQAPIEWFTKLIMTLIHYLFRGAYY